MIGCYPTEIDYATASRFQMSPKQWPSRKRELNSTAPYFLTHAMTKMDSYDISFTSSGLFTERSEESGWTQKALCEWHHDLENVSIDFNTFFLHWNQQEKLRGRRFFMHGKT